MTSFAIKQELVIALEKTVSVDQNELDRAQNYLKEAADRDLAEFLWDMSDILANTENSDVARAAAGLQFKNHLSSKDHVVVQKCQINWHKFPITVRDLIKRNILLALRTENTRPSCAAQCVASVALIELPVNSWCNLIPILVNQVLSEISNEMQQESALQAIGYICQDLPIGTLGMEADEVLTAIIRCMSKDVEVGNRVKLAAAQALLNSLEFTKANFEIEKERNIIMETVCNATQCSYIKVAVTALQCLVKIITLYYQFMEPYMRALLPLTLEAIKSENSHTALQGIEFWSNVCEKEMELTNEIQEAIDQCRTPPMGVFKNYASGACQFLAPLLLHKLTQQQESDDQETWSPAKASSVCLRFLATCCETTLVPLVVPFIQENIQSFDWRYRDAAALALGSVIDASRVVMSRRLVEQMMPNLLELMYDPRFIVRETTTWTISRICNAVPETAVNRNYLDTLLNCCVTISLKSEPRVAANLCWAIAGINKAAYQEAIAIEGNSPTTYCLTPYYDALISHLLEMSDRNDCSQGNLRNAAYEALMVMIRQSPQDCYLTIQRTTICILGRMNAVMEMEMRINNPNDRRFHEMQSLFCALLQALLDKLRPENAQPIAQDTMTTLLQMFQLYASKSAAVLKDSFLAMSTLVHLMGGEFAQYMPPFKHVLLMSMRNYGDVQVCRAALSLSGDICRALEHLIVPYCNDFMSVWLTNLGEPNFPRECKPCVLSAIGDMALSNGSEFLKYLHLVLNILKEASNLSSDPNHSYDTKEYVSELQESVLDAYTGIFHGLKGATGDASQLEPHLVDIIEFIKRIGAGSKPKSVTVFLGDLASEFGAKVQPLLDDSIITQLFAENERETL